MDLEESIRKARMDFLNKVKPTKYPATMSEVKFGTAFSKDIYERSRYVKQD